jgi:ribosomal protein L37AE/L43A
MICPDCKVAMTRTTDANGHPIWLCPMCGRQIPIVQEGSSTAGSKSFSDKEIKQGFRRIK